MPVGLGGTGGGGGGAPRLQSAAEAAALSGDVLLTLAGSVGAIGTGGGVEACMAPGSPAFANIARALDAALPQLSKEAFL